MSKKYLMDTLESRGDLAFCHADPHNSSYLVDVWTDDKYLDFFTDVGTASLGHSSTQQIEVLRKMFLEHIPVHAPNLFEHTLRTRVAERICERTGFDRVFFCNSGAEAVEAAIKLARKYQYDREWPDKSWIATYRGGFHGRTYGAMTAGDGPPYHTDGFGPLPAHFAKFENVDEINWDVTAAVMLAPIFGHHDVITYPKMWLENLRQRCTETDTLLIFDEIQTGSGRCGDITYARKMGVQPDILTLAKGIGMGCPAAATLAREDVAKSFTPGSHFTTFGGNPISMAFVEGMLDWLTDANLQSIERKGYYIRNALRELDWTGQVRGEGMLIAFDIDKNAVQFSFECLKEGVLIGAFRPSPVKITPPLNIDLEDIKKGIAAMDRAYRRLA